MAMLTPALSATNSNRSRTEPPSEMVSRAKRNASSNTTTSSTPTPRKMNGPICASDVNLTPHHITTPYPVATPSATVNTPQLAAVANETSGFFTNHWLRDVAMEMRANATATSGMSPVTLRPISLSNARLYAKSTVKGGAREVLIVTLPTVFVLVVPAAEASLVDSAFISASNFSATSLTASSPLSMSRRYAPYTDRAATIRDSLLALSNVLPSSYEGAPNTRSRSRRPNEQESPPPFTRASTAFFRETGSSRALSTSAANAS